MQIPMASGFTAIDAPTPDEYDVCVHCGLCLDACPTYQELGIENQSPRGRVYLIRAVAEGEMALSEAVIDPVFRCLDCRACESVCPSGVPVGALIEKARGQVFALVPQRGLGVLVRQFFLRGVFAKPARLLGLAALLRAYQKNKVLHAIGRILLAVMPRHLRSMEAALPKLGETLSARQTLPELQLPAGTARGRAMMFCGCVGDALFTETNLATARVLRRNGYEVATPKQQGCCGALHVHAGDRAMAKTLARRNIDAFYSCGAEVLVSNAAGCGAALKEYGDLLRDDAAYADKARDLSTRTRDISELLVERGFEPPRGALHRCVTYHDACHLCHAQGVRTQPRALLDAIPGLERVELPESDRCCGAAGIYNITHPEMAAALLKRKMADVPAQVDAVVTGNPGCNLQLRSGANAEGRTLDVLHTVELLDAAYRAEEAGA